ncbi:MAG: Na+/H+ antiporter subunit E [Reyranella sp.]|uniref:Na+/H+ antiporter subunit E n=1 Tax=Reyranella sp. TaxID=1929291 RepID=UPI002731A982|nr:Na+/H+ antiporter subunit E [Reyranella sp.]MDP1965303.1 Na+/H+ antiporter subunit E [Reyranella sp.]MDP2375317.1 Na+/H+ antiporter subunit E [Reyranella sp.]
MKLVHRLLPQPILSLAILGLWLGLAGSVSVGQVLLGTLLALLIPFLTRGFWPDPPRIARPLVGARLVATVLFDIVVANWQVARRVLGPLDRLHPRFIEVPLDLEDNFIATILGSIVSMTPGTVSVDIDQERRLLLVHALDAEDPEALIRAIKARYEAPLKEVFQC